MTKKNCIENDKRYHIEWELLSRESRTTLTGQNDYGLYVICGDHPVYGANTLLYIGQANDQKFAKRLSEKQHTDLINTHFSGPFTLRLGRFIEIDGIAYESWGDAINLSERLLINAHSPAYNSNGVKQVLEWKDKNHIHIFNWGDRGPLLPELSSRRFSYEYWDEDNYPWNTISDPT